MSINPARILVVDDDPSIRNLLNVLLGKVGYEVVLAISGEDALKQALRNPPDLLILDVILPGMDGYTLCRRLRQNPSTRQLPILVLTSQAETADKLAGFNAGADDYLTKPFEPTELVYRVKGLLARGQQAASALEAGPKPKGNTIAVFGTKGGVGKTTFAVNLTLALARLPKTRAVLMDADFSFGDVSVHLNLSPTRTIIDLLPHLGELDQSVINQVLLRHESGARVLLSPYRPEEVEQIQPEHVMTVLRFLAEHFDYVVVDCPASYDDRTLTILEHADQIVVVLTPEIGAVKNTSVFFDLADKLGLAPEKLHVVLNRANSEVGIAAAEIERALQQPVNLRLMSGGRAVVLSVNRGTPMVLDQPQHPFSQQVLHVMDLIRTSSRRSG